MTEYTWEKVEIASAPAVSSKSAHIKLLVGGLLLVGVVVYLIITATSSGARYFITIDELVNSDEYLGQTVRISGAVVGDTIQYDSRNLVIDFTIANIPQQTDNLALTLHQAATDPNATRLQVHIEGEVMPDLLEHEAQAILTGQLGEDGRFYASELLLKCPSRYEEDVPAQVQ